MANAAFSYDQVNDTAAGVERGGLPSPAADADNVRTMKFVVDFAKVKASQPGFESTDYINLVALKQGSYVTDVRAVVTSEGTGSGTKTFHVGDTADPDRYLTAAGGGDLKSAGSKTVVGLTAPHLVGANQNLRVTYTKQTAATVDDGTVVIAVRTLDMTDEWDGFNSGGV